MIIAVYSLLTLSLFSLARILLYLLYFHKKKSLKASEVIRCLWLGLPFDLSIFMTFFGLLILLYFLPFGFSKSDVYQYAIFSIWFIFFLTVFVITLGDLLYFKYVKRHLTNELRFFLTETKVIIKTFITGYLFAAAVSFILVLIVVWLWFKIPGFFPYHEDGFAISLLKFIFVLFVVIYFMHGKGLSGKPIATVDANRFVSRDEAMLIMNALFSSTHYLYNARKRRFTSIMDDKEAEKRVINLINPHKINIHSDAPLLQLNLNTPLPSLHSGRKKNIVLIVIEGFNSHNILSLFKNTPSPWKNYNVMPFTSALAEKSWSFTNFFANGQRTIDMVHTLLTSIPRLGGVPLIGYDHDFSVINYSYLPQILKKNGYSTSVYNGPWAKSIHMDSIASLSGFDSYIAGEDINRIYLQKSNLATSKVGAWDEHLFDLVYNNLSQKEAPYFSLVFTATSHAPYQVPEKKHEIFGAESDKERYFNCNRYLDNVLEKFFNQVDKSSSFDETIFIITGDHNLFQLDAPWDTTNLFHLPLIIHNPKLFPPSRDNRVASHMDLFPLILDLAGNSEPHVNFGRSLLKKEITPFAIMSQGEDIHATDGSNWIIYGNIQNEPESYKIKEGYFLEKTKLQDDSLKLAVKAYYQCSNRLFQENRFYPKSDC